MVEFLVSNNLLYNFQLLFVKGNYCHIDSVPIIISWVENSLGDRFLIIYGISQGIVLGQLLFFIYINDLLRHMNTDDTKIYRERREKHEQEFFQNGFDSLKAWLLSFGIISNSYYICCVFHLTAYYLCLSGMGFFRFLTEIRFFRAIWVILEIDADPV